MKEEPEVPNTNPYHWDNNWPPGEREKYMKSLNKKGWFGCPYVKPTVGVVVIGGLGVAAYYYKKKKTKADPILDLA